MLVFPFNYLDRFLDKKLFSVFGFGFCASLFDFSDLWKNLNKPNKTYNPKIEKLKQNLKHVGLTFTHRVKNHSFANDFSLRCLVDDFSLCGLIFRFAKNHSSYCKAKKPTNHSGKRKSN